MFEGKNQKKEEPIVESLEIADEDIYVMPARFRKGRKRFVTRAEGTYFARPAAKKFPLWLIWVFLFLIIIIPAGIFYFKSDLILSLFLSPSKPSVINQPVVINQPAVINQPEVVNGLEPIIPEVSPEQTLKAEFEKEGERIGQIELYLPKGAIPFGNEIKLEAFSPSNESQEKYKIIGGVFKISPPVSLLKPVTLKIFYPENEVEKIWEDDLKIGYFKDNYWIILPTEIDIENNKLTSQITYFPSQIYAALIFQEKTSIQPTEYQEIATGILSAPDIDKDALTNKEEEIYRTDKNNPDTDGDSYLDGLEIIHLYSPLSGPGDRLAASDLVRSYNNLTYLYSVFYPTSWQVKTMPGSEDREILFVTGTGELIEIIIQENPENLPVLDWYKKQVKDLDLSKTKTTTIAGQEGVWSLDGLTLYFGQEDKIYLFTYNLGGIEAANFKSTFLMMTKSFRFISTGSSPENSAVNPESD